MNSLRYAVVAAAVMLSSCAVKPPAHWASGGGQLVIGEATWQRADETVKIRADGSVVEDGHVAFSLDKVGRVYDPDNAPVAVVAPDGVVEGTEGQVLGEVGDATAAPPGRKFAWLGLAPDGKLIRYGEDGVQTVDGDWTGCAGPMARTCVLVSHLIVLQEWRSRPRAGVGVGVGFGFGVGLPIR